MKMNYHPKNNFNSSKRRGSKKIIIFGTIFLFFFIFIFSFNSTKGLLFVIGKPFWSIKNSVSSFFDVNKNLLISKKNLILENVSLKEENRNNRNDIILLDLIRKENDDLKGILGRKNTSLNIILSTILVKPIFSSYDTLIIDVGSENNVSVNDKVLAEGNIFIGYVSEVYNYTSKVVLYSSPNEKIAVLVGDNNIEKEALGIGGGNFRLETPREIDIKEGDIITIPSLSLNVFGIVEKVEFKDSDSFQRVFFKNPVNIQELKWVQIILTNTKK